MKKYRLVVMAAVLACFFRTGESVDAGTNLQAFFSPAEIQLLKTGIIVSRCRVRDGKSVAAGGVAQSINIPAIGLLPADLAGFELLAEEKAFIPNRGGIHDPVALCNLLTAYSRLTGMKYFSKTDGNVETLIMRCGRVASPGSATLLPDPVYTDIQSRRTNYILVRDNRFGEQTFRSDIIVQENMTVLKNVSMTSMKKFGMLVNNAGEYQLVYFFIYDKASRGYYYYALHAMRIRSGSFRSMGLVTPESFGNRLRANTVHYAGLMGLNWINRIDPFK